jgi:predicted RNA-binding Zn-ribbon protein involved in translation (DUF1610 family)
METKICPSCGEENVANTLHCIKCGQSLMKVKPASDQNELHCIHCGIQIQGQEKARLEAHFGSRESANIPIPCPSCKKNISKEDFERMVAGEVGKYPLTLIITSKVGGQKRQITITNF